jgi:hypothetical protein
VNHQVSEEPAIIVGQQSTMGLHPDPACGVVTVRVQLVDTLFPGFDRALPELEEYALTANLNCWCPPGAAAGDWRDLDILQIPVTPEARRFNAGEPG